MSQPSARFPILSAPRCGGSGWLFPSSTLIRPCPSVSICTLTNFPCPPKLRKVITKLGTRIDVIFAMDLSNATAPLCEWITDLNEVSPHSIDNPVFPATLLNAGLDNGLRFWLHQRARKDRQTGPQDRPRRPRSWRFACLRPTRIPASAGRHATKKSITEVEFIANAQNLDQPARYPSLASIGR